MALRTNKSIFYHIPKTGGVWVEYVIRKIDRNAMYVGKKQSSLFNLIESSSFFEKHILPRDVDEEDKKGFFSYTFIRHPVEWYKSFWCYKKYKRKHKIKNTNLNSLFSKCWDDNFEQFISNILIAFPKGFVTKLYQYYIGKNGKEINFIGKQENLKEDLIKALTLAGEKFDINIINNIAKRNVSKGKNKLKINKKLKNKILKIEHWIIDNFYE